MTAALFPLGMLVQTPGVERQVMPARVAECIALHASGSWGEVDSWDARANDRALRDGSRVLSVYYIDPESPQEGKLWIITEADRSSTTVLLPEEY